MKPENSSHMIWSNNFSDRKKWNSVDVTDFSEYLLDINGNNLLPERENIFEKSFLFSQKKKMINEFKNLVYVLNQSSSICVPRNWMLPAAVLVPSPPPPNLCYFIIFTKTHMGVIYVSYLKWKLWFFDFFIPAKVIIQNFLKSVYFILIIVSIFKKNLKIFRYHNFEVIAR